MKSLRAMCLAAMRKAVFLDIKPHQVTPTSWELCDELKCTVLVEKLELDERRCFYVCSCSRNAISGEPCHHIATVYLLPNECRLRFLALFGLTQSSVTIPICNDPDIFALDPCFVEDQFIRDLSTRRGANDQEHFTTWLSTSD